MLISPEPTLLTGTCPELPGHRNVFILISFIIVQVSMTLIQSRAELTWMCCIAEVVAVELMSLAHIIQDTSLWLDKSHVSTNAWLDRQKYRSTFSLSEDDVNGWSLRRFLLLMKRFGTLFMRMKTKSQENYCINPVLLTLTWSLVLLSFHMSCPGWWWYWLPSCQAVWQLCHCLQLMVCHSLYLVTSNCWRE